MVGHTFSKFAIILHLLSYEVERRNLKSRGNARFCQEYHATNHTFTINTNMEEAPKEFKKRDPTTARHASFNQSTKPLLISSQSRTIIN